MRNFKWAQIDYYCRNVLALSDSVLNDSEPDALKRDRIGAIMDVVDVTSPPGFDEPREVEAKRKIQLAAFLRRVSDAPIREIEKLINQLELALNRLEGGELRVSPEEYAHGYKTRAIAFKAILRITRN